MDFNTINEIVNSGVFLKLSKNERDFLIKNLSDDSANMPPDSYNVYGKQIGSGNSRPFRFYKPIIERTPNGNKIVGFSWKPVGFGQLPGTGGTSSEKNRSPINEETTDAVINLANQGEISKREAISIIRARIGLEQANFPYAIPKEPFTDNDIQRPIVFGVNYGEGSYPGTNFNGAPGLTTLNEHLSSIQRSENHKKTITDFYNELQDKISSGEFKMTFCANGKMIIYELVDNPYWNQHKFGTSQTDADLDGKTDVPGRFASENENNLPRWVPEKIKKPVSLDLSEFYKLNDDEKALDSFYLDLLMSRRNINGEKLPSSPSEEFENLFNTGSEHHSYGKIGEAIYGSKYKVYGGFLALIVASKLLQRYGVKIPLVRSFIAKYPGGFTEKALEHFLEKVELFGLTSFKLLKDLATGDLFKLGRDLAVASISYTLEHGGYIAKTAISGIPWVGWGIAGLVIAYDAIQPIISEKMDEQDAKNRYIEALQSQNHDNPNSIYYKNPGKTLNWRLLQNGQGIDPGMAIYEPDCIIPIDIDPEGENTEAPIGIEKDKDGNPIIDPKTKRPKLIYPRRRKYKPISPRFQNHYTPSDEIGMQSDIESNTIEIGLGNLAIAHTNSDLDHVPQSSIQIPYRQEPEPFDPTNEYRRDDLVNPFPEENVIDLNPNGLPTVLLSEFFVRQPDRTGVVYIYGEKLIYPNNAPTGNSDINQTSNQTMDSTFIRSGG